MAVLVERRVSNAARWSRRLAYFSAALLLTSIFGHRVNAVDTIAFFWLLGIVVGLAIFALLLSAFGFFQLWESGDKGGRNSVKGLLMALIVLAPFCVGAVQFFRQPKLTDISTDLVDPPRFVHALRERPAQSNPILEFSPQHVAIQIDNYPEVTGRRYPLSMETVRELTETVVGRLGWIEYGLYRAPSRGSVRTIEAAAPSPWIGLVSDTAIRLIDEGETTYVDIRSTSRYGLHDLGDNAARINRFFAALEEEIAARNALFPAPAE